MTDLVDLLTAAVYVTALPTIIGTLIAYSIISVVVGILLIVAKSIRNDYGIVAAGSGIMIGSLLLAFTILFNTLLS